MTILYYLVSEFVISENLILFINKTIMDFLRSKLRVYVSIISNKKK